MKKVIIKEVLSRQPENQTVNVNGWVRTKRDSKTVCFFEINDGSCMKNLQIILDKEKFDASEDLNGLIQRLNTGASVTVEGVLRESPGKGQSVEVDAKKITVIGLSLIHI